MKTATAVLILAALWGGFFMAAVAAVAAEQEPDW